MRLAFDVLEKEGSAPAVLNVANEQAVYRFLKNEISFNEISHIIEMACDQHNYISQPTLDDLLKLEIWSTDFVKSYRSKN